MATEINIKNLPIGFQSIINNGKHSVLGDEPIKSGGTNLGFSPEDLLVASLAMCKVATVRYIARKKGWEIGEVDAKLIQKTKRHADRSLSTNVEVEIEIEGALTAEQKEVLLYEADHCYIHRMIEGNWNIENAKRSKTNIKSELLINNN